MRHVRAFSYVSKSVLVYFELHKLDGGQTTESQSLPPLLVDIEIVLAQGIGEVFVGHDLMPRHVEVGQLGGEAILCCAGQEPGWFVGWTSRQIRRHS